MKNFKNLLKSYNFYLSLTASAVMITELLNNLFGLGISDIKVISVGATIIGILSIFKVIDKSFKGIEDINISVSEDVQQILNKTENQDKNENNKK